MAGQPTPPRPRTRLVIDASIASSAGEMTAKDPRSASCRAFLMSVRDICPRAVFCDPLHEEWTKHQSGFARRWLVSMRQIEKIVDVPTVEQAGLREAIGILPVDPGVLRAIRKDLHLVEAALQTDRIIVSLDDKMREHLATAALRIADLKRIMWVNPTESRDNLRRWLNDGAKWKPTRALGRVRKS